MGRTTAPVPNRAASVGSTDAFYGSKAPILPSPLAKNAPSWGGQKTLPMAGAPTVPPNPYADAAWRIQLARGAMGTPGVRQPARPAGPKIVQQT